MLGIHRKATNTAAKAELGGFPLLIRLICKAVKYWLNLQLCDPETIKFKCLLENYELCRTGKNCWIKGVRDILSLTGMQETWNNVGGTTPHFVVKKLEKTS